ncbi:hypothetical protein LJR296_007893 [Cupriavidus necator]|uniref:hypothetical protein n=1 Tax=Cupriavidus necator TaxID=106590 RepID=UPI003ED11508
MKIDQQELSLYVQAIKSSFENGEFSQSDCQHLAYMFAQGGLYGCALQHGTLLDVPAKAGIADFIRLIRENLEAPEVDANTDISYALNRKANVVNADQLRPEFVKDSDLSFREFLTNLLSGIQADIVELSVEAEALPTDKKADAHYVIGMLEVTARNLDAAFAGPAGASDMAPSALARFFEDSCRFVASVKGELHH